MIERSVTIGETKRFGIVGLTAYMDIDGIGVRVHYFGEKPLIPGIVRPYAPYTEAETNCTVEARNSAEAITIVNQRRNFKIGSQKPISRINDKKEIIELPACEFLRKMSQVFICQPSYHVPNNHGFCVLDRNRVPPWYADLPSYPKECPMIPILQSADM